MPTYWFTVRSGTETARDPEGQHFSDLASAREEAVASVRDIAADRVRFGDPLDLDACIDVADADGRTLLVVAFRDALVLN